MTVPGTLGILYASGPGLALLASTMFVAVYARSPWAATVWGQLIMLSAGAVLLLSSTTFLAGLDQPVDGRSPDWPQLLSWWALAAVHAGAARHAARCARPGATTSATRRHVKPTPMPEQDLDLVIPTFADLPVDDTAEAADATAPEEPDETPEDV